MLSVISTLNTEGVQAGAVYIDTESAFSSERYITIARGVQFDGKVLIAILELWKLQEKKYPEYFGSEEALVRCTESIIVHSVSNSEGLFKV